MINGRLLFTGKHTTYPMWKNKNNFKVLSKTNPPNGGFGKMGSTAWFCDLRKAHLAQNRVFLRIFRQNLCGRFGLSDAKNLTKITELTFRRAKSRMRRNETPSTTCITFLVTIPDLYHLCKFWWWLVKEFGSGGGRILPFPSSHWLWSSPLQHSCTTVWLCDYARLNRV